MNALHIFKAGTHTDMHGRKINFSETMIGDMVQAYDPSLHEAPIVVGHPRTDDPAYGWVKSLAADGSDVLAEPHEVDPAFAELVASKRFKKFRRPSIPRIHPATRSLASITYATWDFWARSRRPSKVSNPPHSVRLKTVWSSLPNGGLPPVRRCLPVCVTSLSRNSAVRPPTK